MIKSLLLIASTGLIAKQVQCQPIVTETVVTTITDTTITETATAGADAATTASATTSSSSNSAEDAYPAGVNGFKYYIDTTIEYASAVPTATATSTYAKAYSDLSSLIGSSVSTTTWGNWDPDATTTATDTDDPYGQYAWSELWSYTEWVNFTRGIYSTTVSPTAIPTSSLVLPPEDPVERAFDDLGMKFPKDFILGVAGSAAQIEGAAADEGKSPTVMEFVYAPEGLPENWVTNENYYLYKQDIARLAAMGVETYSFSIPWTRILPFAYPGTPVNQQGLDHYDDLINTVLEYGMSPMITLTHFDGPAQFYENVTSEIYPSASISQGYEKDYFVDAFVNYAKIVMTHYADRVPLWVTFNEPYFYSMNAQGMKNVVNATAIVHKFYHEEIQGCGKVGIKLSDNFAYPEDPTDSDHVAAADRVNDLYIGAFANPLFLGEDLPESVKETVLARLPSAAWTDEELASVKGGSDFLGIDPYTYTVYAPLDDESLESCIANFDDEYWPWCAQSSSQLSDDWAIGYRSESYVYITPEHLRLFMNYLSQWGLPVFITEFGFPEWMEADKDLKDQLYDLDRSIYYRSFLTAALEASQIDGVEIMGATAWSFADNWEFGDYTQQFGMQVVNRTTQERYYKKSFFDFVKFVQDNREE